MLADILSVTDFANCAVLYCRYGDTGARIAVSALQKINNATIFPAGEQSLHIDCYRRASLAVQRRVSHQRVNNARGVDGTQGAPFAYDRRPPAQPASRRPEGRRDTGSTLLAPEPCFVH